MLPIRFLTFPALMVTAVFGCSPSSGSDAGGGGNGGGGNEPAGGAAGASSGGATQGGTTSAGAAGTGPSGGAAGAGLGGAAGAAGQGGASAGLGGSAAGAGAGTGGAAGDAGASAGAGMGAVGGDAGAGGAAGSGPDPYPGTVIVQDNFDAAAANAQPSATLWEQYQSFEIMNAPTVDTARFRSPPNAARVTSTNVGRGSFLVPLMGFPVSGNTFYVRVFMNWEKATTAITGHSAFVVGSAARENNGTEVRLGISSKGPGSVPRMDLNLQNPSDGMGGEVTRYSNGFTDGGDPGMFPEVGFQFAADTWYCVEAYFGGTMGASEFRVWVDGTEVTDMHVTDFRGSAGGTPRVNWAPTYNFIKIGAQDYDANLGRIWYDDVFVGTEPIGCAR